MRSKITLIIAIITGFFGNPGISQVAPGIRNIESGVRHEVKYDKDIVTGAEQLELLLEQAQFKKIGVVANHTSMVGNTHLVDTLLSLGAEVALIFSPEHGFRGKADAGQTVDTQQDKETGLKVVSLYGNNKKPKLKDLIEIDVMVYDLQDVGARFYTYISTLFYVMEACAEAQKPLIILDRPNPNGFYVAGPVLDMEFSSFVGIAPVPVVYGMTAGEFAMMVNGEGWLYDNMKCDLDVIPCEGYSHSDLYQLPVKPSPNLPDMASVYLYPSLCFLEGTVVSVGRGTEYPFQVFGHPKMKGPFTFTPNPKPGARVPKLEGELCRGYDLRDEGGKYTENPFGLTLEWLIKAYEETGMKKSFFMDNNYFDLLAGSDQLRKQIIEGKGEKEIRKSWEKDLAEFKEIRGKYLLYQE